jgi:serine/threonine protein kinase
MLESMWSAKSPSEQQRPNNVAWQIKFSDLVVQDRVGAGAYGQVFKGLYGSTKLPVAIKVIALSTDVDELADEVAAAKSEMKILWELRHPNTLTFYGTSFVRRKGADQMCLVTELCAGSLEVYLGSAKKLQGAIAAGMPDFTNELAVSWMKDTACGLEFMHSKGVVHRDMKPHNIFLASDGTAKIGDFGLSRIMNSSGDVLGKTASYTANIGSPAYMAPELLNAEKANTRYNAAIDIYSFAIILNALWRRSKPFSETDFGSILHLLQSVQDGLRPEIPDDMPAWLSGSTACSLALPNHAASHASSLALPNHAASHTASHRHMPPHIRTRSSPCGHSPFSSLVGSLSYILCPPPLRLSDPVVVSLSLLSDPVVISLSLSSLSSAALMVQCWESDPEKRIKAPEVCKIFTQHQSTDPFLTLSMNSTTGGDIGDPFASVDSYLERTSA